MNQTKLHLKHIARLARLHLEEKELAVLESQVGDILKFVEELKTLDVHGVKPTSHPLALKNVFRENEVLPSLSIEEFLKQSPASRGRFFEVPKIIEDK